VASTPSAVVQSPQPLIDAYQTPGYNMPQIPFNSQTTPLQQQQQPRSMFNNNPPYYNSYDGAPTNVYNPNASEIHDLNHANKYPPASMLQSQPPQHLQPYQTAQIQNPQLKSPHVNSHIQPQIVANNVHH
jgi:hypothetical protein